MKQFSKLLLVVLGSLALVLGLSLLPTQKAEGKGGSTPVEVTNTPLPVSVSGVPDVNITNSSLPVTLTGAVDASGSSVIVGNATDAGGNPVPLVTSDANDPAPEAADVTLCRSFGVSTFCESNPNLGDHYIVPDGKRFVIQFVSGRCEADTGYVKDVVVAAVLTSPTPAYHFYSIMRNPTPSSTLTNFSHLVRIYADPNFDVDLTVHNSGEVTGGQNGGCYVDLSGYMVPHTFTFPAP